MTYIRKLDSSTECFTYLNMKFDHDHKESYLHKAKLQFAVCTCSKCTSLPCQLGQTNVAFDNQYFLSIKRSQPSKNWSNLSLLIVPRLRPNH